MIISVSVSQRGDEISFTKKLGIVCAVYRTLAHRLLCRHDIDDVITDEHNRTEIVVLAKQEIAP